MGCYSSKKDKPVQEPASANFSALAAQTAFNVNKVQSLYELYNKLSSSIFQDGVIQKEELQFALFRNSEKQNLFADRIFDLFDVNRNGHTEFGEFVQSLSVFHPETPQQIKTKYAFRLYDLRHADYIEREDVNFTIHTGPDDNALQLKDMVLALFNESHLALSDEVVEAIVDKTFKEVDTKADGKIDQEEWEEYVPRNPGLLKNMTLPHVMDITLSFPSFVVNAQEDESQL